MRYRSQSVAYWYFALAMVLFGLQLAFGLLAATKYLGPDPLLNVLPFDVAKVIHTNLLVVWVLTGFMGAAYWVVPEESRTELHSVKLAYIQLGLWAAMGVTAVIGYFFRYGTGTKLLEQPLPHKIVIVIVMLMFLYNMLMTVRKGDRFTTTEGVLLGGIGMAAILYLPALINFDNYTVGTFYRWWTIHLWVEGVWEMIQGSLLAYLLIRLTGADREVMEKWLYVIVGPRVHRRHHRHRASLLLDRRAVLLAADRRHLQRARARRARRHGDLRVLGAAPLGARASEYARAPLDGGQRACSRCSAPGCSGSRTRGRRSTNGRTGR